MQSRVIPAVTPSKIVEENIKVEKKSKKLNITLENHFWTYFKKSLKDLKNRKVNLIIGIYITETIPIMAPQIVASKFTCSLFM